MPGHTATGRLNCNLSVSMSPGILPFHANSSRVDGRQDTEPQLHRGDPVITLINEKVAAGHTGFAVGTLRNWRMHGKGPAFIKLPNGSIRYDIAELERWMLSGEKAAA